MGVKHSNYQVVKRGEKLPRLVDGGRVENIPPRIHISIKGLKGRGCI